MTFKVLQKPFEYQKCPIVLRQIGEKFEYITCINNQIYSSFIVARKTVLQRLILGGYTKEQLHKITNYVLAMAQTTIDTVLGTKPEVQEDKNK